MKTKSLILLAVAAIAALASCKKAPEPGDQQQNQQPVVTSDPVEQALSTAASAAVITGGPAFTWAAGDNVSVFDGVRNNKFTAVVSGDKASLEGVALSADLQLLYPYNGEAKRFSGAVAATLPATQTVADGAIDKAAAILISNVAKDAKECTFTTPLAYLKIVSSFETAPAGLEISANGGESLAGTLSVNLATGETTVSGGASTIILSGTNLNGTFYVATVPQTLSKGYTVTVIGKDGARSAQASNDAVELKAGAVTDAGTYNSGNVFFPSTVAKTALWRVSFEEADFNMISEPGFEEFSDKPITYGTRWLTSVQWNGGWHPDLVYGGGEEQAAYFPNHQFHNGERCAHLKTIANPDNGTRAWNLMEQTIPMKKNTDYTFSAWVDANNMDCYMGVNAKGEQNAGHEIPGNQWTQNGSFNNMWKEVTLTFNTGGDYWGYVFFGDWGEGAAAGWPDGGWFNTLYIDDVKVIPTGYSAKSTGPKAVEAKGMIANVGAPVDEVGKIVGWDGGDGSIYYVANDITIDGTAYTNAILQAEQADVTAGAAITKVLATNIASPDAAGAGLILDGGACVDGKIYVHYMNKSEDTYTENPKLARWNLLNEGFIVSADGGKTWNPGAGDNNPFYAQANLCTAGDYVYMVSSWPGRTDSVTDAFFASRVAKSASGIENIATWEHWDGNAWDPGEIVNDLGEITKGAMSEPAIVWNPKFECFMIFYRSAFQQGIIYRDAKAIEGPWSGEKVLLNDDVHGAAYYAPSIVKVDDDGSVWMLVSEF